MCLINVKQKQGKGSQRIAGNTVSMVAELKAGLYMCCWTYIQTCYHARGLVPLSLKKLKHSVLMEMSIITLNTNGIGKSFKCVLLSNEMVSLRAARVQN